MTILVAAIAVAVWVMAAETIVFAAIRIIRWRLERRETLRLAAALVERQRAEQYAPEPVLLASPERWGNHEPSPKGRP